VVLARGHSLPSVGDERHSFGGQVEHISIAISVVMIAIYMAGLFFSLRRIGICSRRRMESRASTRGP
jgi:Ca2+/H+ antiporter